MDDLMTPQHPRWAEFIDRLRGPEGCNVRDGVVKRWTCEEDTTLATQILIAMGFTDNAVAASLEFFAARGGDCDCAILFEMGR